MRQTTLFAVFFMALPVAVQAHPGGHFGFLAGLEHPLGGADHVLAMIAVGLWAAMIGGRAMWAMPLTFVTAMMVGGALGAQAVPFPAVEPMILASIVLLGVAAALALRLPLPLSMAGIAVFGLAHGHAHGAEGPVGTMLTFGAGFVLATVALHLVGLALGWALIRFDQRRVVQGLGLAVAAAGVALVVAA
jgi:urease accessory protein